MTWTVHRPRRTLVWLLLALLAAATALAATERRVRRLDLDVEHPVYRLPEGLPVPEGHQSYRLSWSGIPVGHVRLAMQPEAGGERVGVDIRGATHPVIDWLWRYRFVGEGHVRTRPFAPGGFVVDECENRRHKRTEIRFGAGAPDRVTGLRIRRGEEKEYVFESSNTYDLPSSVYLVLNLDYAPGASFRLETFTGRSRYQVDVDVRGLETVRLGEAPHEAWHLFLRTTELTDDDPEGRHRGTDVWVTSERPRQLLRATSRTYVGRVWLEREPSGEHDARLRTLHCA